MEKNQKIESKDQHKLKEKAKIEMLLGLGVNLKNKGDLDVKALKQEIEEDKKKFAEKLEKYSNFIGTKENDDKKELQKSKDVASVKDELVITSRKK